MHLFSGPSFVHTVWSNQHDNPDYAFLKPENEFYPYFQSKLWEQFENLEGGQNKEQLPEHLKDSWRKLLGQLNGSELSVKKCQGWFMSFSQYSLGFFEILSTEVCNASDSYQVMNLFSLLDDILNRILDDTTKGVSMIDSLDPQLNAMFEKSGTFRDVDLSERLKSMISSWSKKQIFSVARAEEMMQYLDGKLRNTLDGSENDSISFPAGLIPKLCRDIRDVYPPYTPLNSGDIPKDDQLDPPNMDEYLSARIESFYDLIHEYRPGMTYDKICPGLQTGNYKRQAQSQLSHAVLGNDGSYRGSIRAGTSAKGLGYDRSMGQDKTLDEFRIMRKHASYKKT